jgi:predicted acetyltransferase
MRDSFELRVVDVGDHFEFSSMADAVGSATLSLLVVEANFGCFAH